MEIPRHWRLKKQRYSLIGIRIVHNNGTIEYQFPPKADPKKQNDNLVYDSNLLLPPNDQVVHSEVVGENQE